MRNNEWEMYQRLAWQPDLNQRIRAVAESGLHKDSVDTVYEAMQRIDAQQQHIGFLTKKIDEMINEMRFCAYCGRKHEPSADKIDEEPTSQQEE